MTYSDWYPGDRESVNVLAVGVTMMTTTMTVRVAGCVPLFFFALFWRKEADVRQNQVEVDIKTKSTVSVGVKELYDTGKPVL